MTSEDDLYDTNDSRDSISHNSFLNSSNEQAMNYFNDNQNTHSSNDQRSHQHHFNMLNKQEVHSSKTPSSYEEGTILDGLLDEAEPLSFAKHAELKEKWEEGFRRGARPEQLIQGSQNKSWKEDAPVDKTWLEEAVKGNNATDTVRKSVDFSKCKFSRDVEGSVKSRLADAVTDHGDVTKIGDAIKDDFTIQPREEVMESQLEKGLLYNNVELNKEESIMYRKEEFIEALNGESYAEGGVEEVMEGDKYEGCQARSLGNAMDGSKGDKLDRTEVKLEGGMELEETDYEAEEITEEEVRLAKELDARSREKREQESEERQRKPENNRQLVVEDCAPKPSEIKAKPVREAVKIPFKEVELAKGLDARMRKEKQNKGDTNPQLVEDGGCLEPKLVTVQKKPSNVQEDQPAKELAYYNIFTTNRKSQKGPELINFAARPSPKINLHK